MKIIEMNVTAPFMYIWLKSVKGVDITKHCARCIIGEYQSFVNKDVKHIEGISLDEDIYYLCGVSMPYVWKKNFHLAFRKCEGKVLTVNENGIQIAIENAERIEISRSDIDYSLPYAHKSEYSTCRNWQFANKYIKGIRK